MNMKRSRYFLALALWVPACTLLGGYSTRDGGAVAPTWWGLAIGAVIGIVLGFCCGMNQNWWLWRCLVGRKKTGIYDEDSHNGA